MGYTWTDGELITATKLNNTGGGGGLSVHEETDNDPIFTLDCSYNDLLGEVADGLLPCIMNDSGGRFALLVSIYDNGDDEYTAAFVHYGNIILYSSTTNSGALSAYLD